MKFLDIFKSKPSKPKPSEGAYHPTYWDGIKRSRERNDIPYMLKSARYGNTHGRREMASLSRYLYDNDGVVRGAINDMARYSFPLLPQAKTDDAYWNHDAEEYFEDWANYCDASGRYGFSEFQKLLSIGIDRDGDSGVLFAEDNGIKLQYVESHRIGDYIEHDDKHVDGVKVDRHGKPLSYVVAEEYSSAGTFYTPHVKSRVISSKNMMLLLEPERSQQYRGMPAIKHAANHIRDIKEILDYEKVGVKNLSTIAAVLESETGEADPDAWNTSDIVEDATRLTINEVQSGSIPVLKKGEKLTPFDYNRPSSTFEGFLEFLIREFAVGIGLPYEFLWHPAGITGPAQRFIMGKAQRRFAERQRLFYPFVQKVWALVIAQGIRQGKLTDIEGWNRCRIQCPAQLTIDAGREAREEREDVASGLMTLREHYGRRGLDWQSECQQRGKELKYLIEKSAVLAKETGLDEKQIMNYLLNTSIGAEQEEQEESDQEENENEADS